MHGISTTRFFDEKKGYALALLFVFSFLVLLARHPHALFNAQFWAEDGAYWYVDAYTIGVARSLLSTSVGYFQTLSRIVAGIATMLPLKYAPVFVNLFAMVVQIVPAILFVSSRFSKLVPDTRIRVLLALMYLLMPNSGELHANITNAQWYLALATCMVYLADVSRTKIAKTLDLVITALSALSGPFVVFLAPIAVFQWYRAREAWRGVIAMVAVVGVFIQVLGIFFFNAGSRMSELPDMSFSLLSAILEKQVFLGSVMGWRGYNILSGWGSVGEILLRLSFFLGVFLLIYAMLKAGTELRVFIIFSFALFFAGMISPTIGGEDRILDSVKEGWDLLLRSSSGIRYWLMPIIAFHVTLIWGMARARPLGIRVASMIFLGLLSFGVVNDFRDKPFQDFDFMARAEIFERISSGESVEIPLNPPGWSMKLVKK